MTVPTVVPVILAAGESRRMGSPKPFLEAGGKTFLEHITANLEAAGLPRPIVVGNPAHADLYTSSGWAGAALVMNPHPENGMLSSLRLGLARLPEEATHALVCLVDMPFVSAATHAAVARLAEANPERIIVARTNGTDGHPVAWPRGCVAELNTWNGSDGARGFLRANDARVLRCDVEDPNVLVDFDTPEMLRRAGFVV
ncbi:MAG: molybdenum cofactor cytidylyltransferase [Candidatus Sumerlaeota bacterium]|nr:molybdenum cofactor cytidylyltransferase [Candidatus Sumerlaeota bacterium]